MPAIASALLAALTSALGKSDGAATTGAPSATGLQGQGFEALLASLLGGGDQAVGDGDAKALEAGTLPAAPVRSRPDAARTDGLEALLAAAGLAPFASQVAPATTTEEGAPVAAASAGAQATPAPFAEGLPADTVGAVPASVIETGDETAVAPADATPAFDIAAADVEDTAVDAFDIEGEPPAVDPRPTRSSRADSGVAWRASHPLPPEAASVEPLVAAPTPAEAAPARQRAAEVLSTTPAALEAIARQPGVASILGRAAAETRVAPVVVAEASTPAGDEAVIEPQVEALTELADAPAPRAGPARVGTIAAPVPTAAPLQARTAAPTTPVAPEARTVAQSAAAQPLTTAPTVQPDATPTPAAAVAVTFASEAVEVAAAPAAEAESAAVASEVAETPAQPRKSETRRTAQSVEAVRTDVVRDADRKLLATDVKPVAETPDTESDAVEPVLAQAADDADAAADDDQRSPAPIPVRAADAASVDRAAQAAVATPVRGSPETVAKLASDMTRKLEGQTSKFDLQLDPLGLGKVDVSIEINADGRLTAALSFDSAHAANELKARAGELRQALQQAGFDVSDNGLSFDLSGQNAGFGREARDQAEAWTSRAFATVQAELDEADARLSAALSTYARPASGGVDIRI